MAGALLGGDAPFWLAIASRAFTRTILEVLKDSDQPMTVRDIADVLVTRAERPLDRREVNLVGAERVPRLSDRLTGELGGGWYNR